MLAIGVLPVIGALALFGNRMDMIAGGVVLLAALFLMQMIQQQHSQIVDLLRLQRGMQTLAETDALTGLPNRRALYDRLDRGARAAPAHRHCVDRPGRVQAGQ